MYIINYMCNILVTILYIISCHIINITNNNNMYFRCVLLVSNLFPCFRLLCMSANMYVCYICACLPLNKEVVNCDQMVGTIVLF